MEALFLFAFFNWVAIAYLIVIVVLLVLRNTAGVLISVVMAALAMAVLTWWFLRSGNDVTLELFTLPTVGAVAGFVGLLFGRWRSSPDQLQRVIASGLLAIVLLYLLVLVFKILTHTEGHPKRDLAAEEFSSRLTRARKRISANINRDPNGQGAYLDAMIRSSIDDRAVILAALEQDSVSAGILDTLANGTDSTIVLAVARHRNASAETLTRIYRTHTPADFFAPAVAWNPHTPKDILREIATTTKDPMVITGMLNNPALDCELLKLLEATLKAMPPDTTGAQRFVSESVRLKELKPKICGGSS